VGFIQWDEVVAGEVIAAHAKQDGAMLPLLHALQETFGFIPDAAIPMIAHALNLSRAEVHGVVSFYHDFRHTPPGRHVLKLCRAEACQSMGGDALSDRVRNRLGLDWGETTADGRITLDAVFCLGLCACGPSAMFDGKPFGRVDDTRLDRLIASAR
jgi:formate dehydrogenase subunit gamma